MTASPTSFVFKTWTILMSTGHIFCRIFPLWIVWYFLIISLGLQVWGKNTTGVTIPSHHIILGHMIVAWFMTGNDNPDGSTNAVSARLCHPGYYFTSHTLWTGNEKLTKFSPHSMAENQTPQPRRGVPTHIVWDFSVRKTYLFPWGKITTSLITH